MIEKTAHLINTKKLEGITDIRDESDRNGLRIVYELKRDSIPNVVLNNLYKYTQLQSSFGVNNVALAKGRPKILNLKELIKNYVEHRHEVVVRRTKYDLKEAEKRSHILQGYIIALDNIDNIINMIKKSKNPDEAKLSLIKTYKLSEIQSKAILEMRLQKLTGLEREKINKENNEINKLINSLNDILSSKDQRMNIIKDELNNIKDKYGDKRRSEIEHSAEEFTVEDMIPDEDMVITVSHQGYLKRTSLDEYRTQGRGGLGARGVKTKDDDFNEHLFIASTHNYLLIFTEYGKIFWKKVWEIPEGSKVSKGRAIQNLINIETGDNIRSIITITNLTDEDYLNNNYLVMCTEGGTVKKTKLEAYSRPRVNGIYAITIKENDRLLDVKLTNGDNHIIIAKKSGKAINFHENNVRPMGRTASGVRGVRLENSKDKVIGMICVAREESDLLVVSQNGYGKRSSIKDYRITKRGGKGVMTLKTTEKTGYLVSIKEVKTNDELMIINKSGIAIRTKITDKNIRVMGRATQGVKLIRLSEGDEISSVAKIETIKEEKEEE
jgi:DNA gyrase subunit A